MNEEITLATEATSAINPLVEAAKKAAVSAVVTVIVVEVAQFGLKKIVEKVKSRRKARANSAPEA